MLGQSFGNIFRGISYSSIIHIHYTHSTYTSESWSPHEGTCNCNWCDWLEEQSKKKLNGLKIGPEKVMCLEELSFSEIHSWVWFPWLLTISQSERKANSEKRPVSKCSKRVLVINRCKMFWNQMTALQISGEKKEEQQKSNTTNSSYGS